LDKTSAQGSKTKCSNWIRWPVVLAFACAAMSSAVSDAFAGGAGMLKGVAVLGGGAPMAGGTVAVIDAAGQTASATINGHGRFSVNVTGLNAPFLLQATPPNASAPMYGFASAAGIANVDVYSDLILNLVYGALSTSPHAQFGLGAPLPSGQSTSSLADNLRLVSSMTQNLITSWFLADKVKTAQFTFFDNKFSAGRKKFGLLARQTSIRSAFASDSEAIEISDGKTIQDITFTSAIPGGQVTTGTVTGSSTTQLSGGNQIDVTASTAIMVNPAQAAELDAINALLQTFQRDVNNGGKKLASTDIQPLFSPSYMRGGENLINATADLATGLRGQKLSNIAVTGINSIVTDSGNSGLNDFNVLYSYMSGKQTAAPVTEVFQCPNPIDADPCVFFGNQQLAQTQNAVQLSTLTESTLTAPNVTSAALNVDVLAPQGSLAAVTINDSNNTYFTNDPVNLTNSVEQDFFPTAGGQPLVYMEDEYRLVMTPLGSNPPPGMNFSITVTPTGGSPQAPYITSLTGSPGEPVNLIQPALSGDHSLSAAPVGQTASVKWKLPASYAVQSISVTGEVLGACGAGKQIDPVKPVTAKSTTASIKFPSQLTNPGDIQEIDINIGIRGVNGATSRLVYAYGQCS